jgi:hypothetical protein
MNPIQFFVLQPRENLPAPNETVETVETGENLSIE